MFEQLLASPRIREQHHLLLHGGTDDLSERVLPHALCAMAGTLVRIVAQALAGADVDAGPAG